MGDARGSVVPLSADDVAEVDRVDIAEPTKSGVSFRPHSSKLSSFLWDLDWHHYFPKTLDGIRAEYATYDEIADFVATHYVELFETNEQSPFSGGQVTAARRRYYERTGDFFAFRDGGMTVGVLVCNPIDWGTYHFRSTGILPAYQGRGLLSLLFVQLLEILAVHGVERVETETSPSNLPVVSILSRLGFSVSGSLLSERWGAQTRFTRFLNKQNEEVFLEQFCAGKKHQMGGLHTAAANDNKEGGVS
jgi:ribosomal protein S18 acetylase RimI-like enzyme